MTLELTHCEDKSLRGYKWFWDQRAKSNRDKDHGGLFMNQNKKYIKDFERLQKVIIEDKINFFEKYYNKKLNILDVGCGPGRMSEFLSSFALEYTGIDFCSEFIERAKQKYPDKDFQCVDIRQEIPLIKNKYDIAIMISCASSTESQFMHIIDNIKQVAKCVLVVEEHWYMFFWPEELISDQDKWG